MAAARLTALGLLVVTAVVAVTTKVGPVIVIFWPDHGLHALDTALIVVSLPSAIVLLRSAERVKRDGDDEARGRRV